MFRRAVCDRVGGYRNECEYWEDQDLVARIASVAEVWVLPYGLYQLRQWTRNPRASSDPERFEKAVDTMYRSIARLEQNRSYDDILAERDSRSPARVDPRVFISAGSRVLWAGGRPRVLGRLLRRGRLGLDRPSLAVLIWSLWAEISPVTLRLFLRMLLHSQNSRALRAGPYSEPIRWTGRSD